MVTIKVSGARAVHESDTTIFYETAMDEVTIEATPSLPIGLISHTKSRWDFDKEQEVEKTTSPPMIAIPSVSVKMNTKPLSGQNISMSEFVFTEGIGPIEISKSKKVSVYRDF
jgi:hypothetical protein